MPRVLIPPPYRGPTGGREEIPVEAESVRACVQAVVAQYPGFGELIFDASGQVHRFVRLFCNGEPVEPEQLDRAVQPGDEIEVVAAIAGG